MHRLVKAARTWPITELPRWLVVFVAAVVAADVAAIALAARVSVIRPGDLLLFAALLACGAATIELTRRGGETALLVKDVCGVWEMPMAILLPPVFALLVPIPRFAMTQWRIRKIALHRRVFSAAAISLSYGSVYLAFHGLSGAMTLSLTGAESRAALWIVAVGACFALQWVVNSCLLVLPIKGSDPSANVRKMLTAPEVMRNDLTEICVATVVTLGIAITPVALVFALPFVTLLQRSSRHAQLVDASRTDAKTGLLNAVTWRRESSAEVSRALRTGSGLAVALIDIDYFKAVNDTYGHLAGDDALREVSSTLQALVREYDLVGRFGGEEFALLLPQTDEAGARNIVERIRAQVANLCIEPTSTPGTEPITLTVSIGVAVLGAAGSGGQLTELLAAADAALYRAKGAGRNQVWVT
ncbi:MAG TPA: GGDEF domain-containing protein, partial [Streptosporangiaceae bacterium]|nr:GGDEF domain-containing protein [Streptosporangiaceae bacterium]